MVVIIQTSGLNSFRSLTFLSLKELEIASTSWFASTIPIWRWLEVINHSVLDAGMWWLSHRVVSDSCDPMDYSLPGSSVHEISQARTLEWVAISFSRGSSWPRIKPESPALAGAFFTTEPPGKALSSSTFLFFFYLFFLCLHLSRQQEGQQQKRMKENQLKFNLWNHGVLGLNETLDFIYSNPFVLLIRKLRSIKRVDENTQLVGYHRSQGLWPTASREGAESGQSSGL